MLRNRLKNIINKSREISNKKQVGDPFDEFKKSLPKEIEIGDNYRLEAAWKAYGSPKDYKTALWYGMIQLIDETNVKLPSIGYNEETDEYEYLNKGEDNETVAKDIRVWDNDVIPLVQELKLGGYVRTFNKEKDCWTYSKNSQKRVESPEDKELQINYFLKGGKNNDHPTYDENLDPDYKGRYGWFGSDETGWEFHPSPRLLLIFGTPGKDAITFYKEYWDLNEPTSTLVIGEYGKPAAWSYNRIPKEERLKSFLLKMKINNNHLEYPNSTYVEKPQVFKQGGQMNVIPEGALHARKNEMELAKEGAITHKGIPVVDNNGEQQAEIEKNEVIFTKDLTDFIENNLKKFNSEEISNSEKDEIAIKVGKRLVKELLTNTDDRTGLIEEVLEKM